MLFTFAGGSGHLEPLVPLARAAEAAGHTVAFAGRPWMVPRVEALGFLAFPAGSDVGLAPQRRPLATVELEREIRLVGSGFGHRIAGERARDLLPLCAAWQPDVLVCEELDFGAMVVAERLGRPYATVLVIAAGSFIRADVVAEPLGQVRAEHGLPPDSQLAMLSAYLVLSSFPRSYRDPSAPLPPTTHMYCPLVRDSVSNAAPDWLTRLGDAPTVYFTLGTVFNVECGDLFDRVLGGLRDLPINLVVTVGYDIDPTELGPQPANVRIEQYIPQVQLLPHCALVVSHGGSGSVIGTLAHGLPMVLIPMGADHPLNAARCEALGVARVCDPTATSQTVRATVECVLADPSYRQSAQCLRDEIASLPAPEHTVSLLERLAREKRPLFASAAARSGSLPRSS